MKARAPKSAIITVPIVVPTIKPGLAAGPPEGVDTGLPTNDSFCSSCGTGAWKLAVTASGIGGALSIIALASETSGKEGVVAEVARDVGSLGAGRSIGGGEKEDSGPGGTDESNEGESLVMPAISGISWGDKGAPVRKGGMGGKGGGSGGGSGGKNESGGGGYR